MTLGLCSVPTGRRLIGGSCLCQLLFNGSRDLIDVSRRCQMAGQMLSTNSFCTHSINWSRDRRSFFCLFVAYNTVAYVFFSGLSSEESGLGETIVSSLQS